MKRLALYGLIISTVVIVAFGCSKKESAQTEAVVKEQSPAPEVTVNSLKNAPLKLSELKGKVVLLNFWATWCTPCLVELPSLIQLHRDQPNLVILGVSVDEDADAYKSFITRRHIEFTTVRDPSESAAKLFKTEMWPETYIIDRNGYIRSKYVGATDWSDPEIRAFIKSL